MARRLAISAVNRDPWHLVNVARGELVCCVCVCLCVCGCLSGNPDSD